VRLTGRVPTSEPAHVVVLAELCRRNTGVKRAPFIRRRLRLMSVARGNEQEQAKREAHDES
jgi:hypothetical protein